MKLPWKTLAVLLIILCGYLLLSRLVVPGMKKIFSSAPVVIDETPILIKEIKSIGQLVTYTSFDEVVADSLIATRGSALVNTFNRLAPLPLLPSAGKQLVMICRGKVVAGVDLTRLSDSSLYVRNDTVYLSLPAAQILDAVLNPSDFETFVEKGEWNNQEVILVKNQARRKMITKAVQQNILVKA